MAEHAAGPASEEGARPDTPPTASGVPRKTLGGFLWRYSWLILITLAGAVGYTVHYTGEMEPVYRATAILEVSPPRTGISVEAVLGVDTFHREYVATMARRVTLRSITEPIYEKHRLEGQTFEAFRDSIEANPEEGTNLVIVNLEGVSRERIVEIVDLTIQGFLASVAADRDERSASARGILDAKSEQLRGKIDDARNRLDAFMAEHGLRSSIQAEWDLKYELLQERTKLGEATRHELALAEAVYQEIQSMRAKRADLSTLPLVAMNTAYTDLEETLGDVHRELVDASVDYQATHPKYLAVKEKYDATRNQLERMLKRLVEQAERNYAILRDSVAKHMLERAELESQLRVMDGRRFEYDRIQRDVDRYQAGYDKYVAATRDIEPADDMSRANVKVREAAAASTDPVKPIWVVNIGLAVLAGLLAGIFLGLFFDALRG